MKKTSGFTLIELMVVIAVIAILATIALFGLTNAQKSARDTQRMQIMNSIRTALEKYKADVTTGYPTGSFGPMLSTLMGSNYLGAPVDPKDGSGLVTFVNTTANHWVPTTGVTYQYVGTASNYTLSLIKEGGGTSTFKNPL